MKTFLEARGDTAVFTFGRFNPPTTGHEKLIDALAKEQGKNPGSLMYVYPSHSQNAKKDPLPHNKKVAYMKKMFPKYKRNIKVSRARNVFDIAVELHNRGHKAVVMVVGSDRVEEFDNLLNKYNGEEGRHGFYGFDDIKVVSAGERDPDAEGVTGMSASKMRAAATANDFDQFKLGLPKGFADGQKLFNDVRKFMGINEEYDLTLEELNRDLYIRGEIWNVGDVVKTTDGDEGTIIRKGTNYVVFEDLRRVWLHNLEEVKQDKDIKDREGTQPAKYYAKDADGDEMSTATKKARARHFEKGKKGPAPGDAGADTKPSKHTKKFKQMYGEGKMKDISMDTELMKLYTKAMKTMPGSPAQKKIIDKINKRRKELGMKEGYVSEAKGDLNDLKAMVKELQGAVKIHKGQSERVAAHIAMMDKAGDEGPKGQGGKKDLQNIVKELEKASQSHERQSISVQKHIDFMVSMEEVILERKLTDAEKDKLKKYEKDIDIKDFIDRYGEEEGKSIYYATLTKMAKQEGLWDNIRKKKERIARGSGEKMRKVGDKGAPTPAQMKRAQGEQTLNCGCGKEPCETYGNIESQSDIEQIDEKIAGLVKKAEKSGMPYSILKKVYDRGMAAYKTGHRPGTTAQQWAFARVNSFTTKSKGTWGKADADLAAKVRGEDVDEKTYLRKDSKLKNLKVPVKRRSGRIIKSSYEIGKDYGDHTRKVTPGQQVTKESLEEWYLDESVRDKYEERYGDEWLSKLTKTYHAMLEKVPCCEDCSEHFDHIVEDAEYQGRKVKLNDPIRTSENPNKKFKVYVKNEKGKVVVVRFGDPNMSINRDDPGARKNFRARHNCDDPGPKTKARYWSCFQWRAGAKVDN